MYQVEGIILKKQDLGEADKVLVVYTKELGKIKAKAKGVKKQTSKLAGDLDLFTKSNLFLARGKNLDIICHSEVLDYFLTIKKNLALLNCTFYISNFIDKIVLEGQKNIFLYNLLNRSFYLLKEKKDPTIVKKYFEICFLKYSGHQPELNHCVACHSNLKKDNFLSSNLGGMICSDCLYLDENALPVPLDLIKILRIFSQEDLKTIFRIKNINNYLKNLDNITAYFITNIFQKNFLNHKIK